LRFQAQQAFVQLTVFTFQVDHWHEVEGEVIVVDGLADQCDPAVDAFGLGAIDGTGVEAR
jgi:hypothetical protein